MPNAEILTKATLTTNFAALNGHEYMSLKTFRKNAEGVPTPVWFAQAGEQGKKLYVVTSANSGKVKRIRNNHQVEVAPCDMRGKLHEVDYIPAHARILSTEEGRHADDLLNRKYGWKKRIAEFVERLRGMSEKAYLEITTG